MINVGLCHKRLFSFLYNLMNIDLYKKQISVIKYIMCVCVHIFNYIGKNILKIIFH